MSCHLIMRTLRAFMSVWLLLLGATAGGQEYSHLHFSTRDGLAGDNIYDIAQDKDGFLWIATETGVSRFDGTRFVNFTVRDGLPGNDVNSFFIDRKNRVWVSAFKKDICYYYHGQIRNRDNDSLVRSIRISSERKCMASDQSGNMLIQTDSCFAVIDTNDRCTNYTLPFRGKGFFIPEICDCNLPADIVHPSLLRYSTSNGEYRTYCGIPMPQRRLHLIRDEKKGVMIFGEQGPPQVCYPPAGVVSAFPSGNDGFLIHTVHGAYYYDIPSGKITGSFLEGVPVNISFTDRESGIWIGTLGAGLYYFPPGRNVSITHTPEHLPLQAYNFYFGNGRLLLGTNKGLWELDQRHRRLSSRIDSAGPDTNLCLVPEGNTLKVPDTRIPHYLLQQYPGLEKQYFKSIAHCGNSLLASDGSGRIRQFTMSGELLKTIVWEGRLTCAFAADSFCYAGTLDGLYVFDRNREQAGSGQSTLLVPGSIHSMARGRNGLLWVITTNNGAWCLKDNRVIRRLTEADGLSSNICKCLFIARDGNVYIGTINGLNVIDPAQGFRVCSYFRADGLVSDNINCIYASGDTVLAGTSEGLSILDVSGRSRHATCSLSFTGISVSQRRIDPDSAAPELAPADNNISFSYAGISFRSMGNIRYTYRLRGLKDEWTHTDQAYLQYPSLPAGMYTLELYATNRFGDRSPLRTFSFSVRRHWWQHAWVQASGVLLLLAILGCVFRFRVRRIRSKAQEQLLLRHKVTELEQLALRAQMNPHFIFNSLNSFYQYVIDKDLAGASKFMSDFSRLIRLLFETTALAEITLDKEISFLGTYLELERTKLGQAFSFSFRLQEGLPTGELLIPSFIIQPFVENSVRHGIQNRRDKEGTIEVAIGTQGPLLQVVVTDNGVGRRHTAALKSRGVGLYESKGMKLTTERIAVYNEIHQADIRFEITDRYENGKAAGTTVTLYFPLKDAL